MSGGQLLSILPLLLAALVPASLAVAAFLISRQGTQVLRVAVFVTSLAAGLTYLAIVLHLLLPPLGFDPHAKAPASVLNEVVQLDLVSSCMFMLVSVLAVIVVRYSRS